MKIEPKAAEVKDPRPVLSKSCEHFSLKNLKQSAKASTKPRQPTVI